jgi:hypothetical protein
MSLTLSGGAAPTAKRRAATWPLCAASTAPQARSSTLHLARAASRAAASAAAAATAARCLEVACALRSACSPLSGRGDGLRCARSCASLLAALSRDAGCGGGCATPGSGAAVAALLQSLFGSHTRLAARGPVRCHCCGHLAADTPSAAGGGRGSLQCAPLWCTAAGVPLRWRYSCSSRWAFARSSTTSRSCAVANWACREAASAWRALKAHTTEQSMGESEHAAAAQIGKPVPHLLARASPSHAPREVVQATRTAVAALRC